MNKEFFLKIIIIGDSSVGKTSLLNMYLGLKEKSNSTIGIEFYKKKIDIENEQINVFFWDTAGQEKFKSICSSYYRGCDGALVVYDITNINTFNSIENWINILNSFNKNIYIMIIGNKSDSPRKVSFKEGQKMADKFNLKFFETSIYDIKTVNEIFNLIILDTYEKHKFIKLDESFDIIINKNNNMNKCC